VGKRGLYREIGESEVAMLCVLSLSGGEHSLLEISHRAGPRFDAVSRVVDLLREHDLLKASR